MGPADRSAFGPALVLAPTGRDAAEIGRILGAMGVPSRAPKSLAALCGELQPDGGTAASALVIAEEALAGGRRRSRRAWRGSRPGRTSR